MYPVHRLSSNLNGEVTVAFGRAPSSLQEDRQEGLQSLHNVHMFLETFAHGLNSFTSFDSSNGSNSPKLKAKPFKEKQFKQLKRDSWKGS